MVHAKAAVTPSSGKVMSEASPEYTSLFNVHDEDDDEPVVVTKAAPKTHRRHKSLFSNASAPVDLSDYPSMRRELSSKTDSTVLRKSTSGNFNWNLGDIWSKFRGTSVKPSTSRSSSLITSKSAENPPPTGTLGFQKTESSGVTKIDSEGKPPLSKKAWKSKGKDEVEVVSPTSKSTSLHFTSLNLFSSSKFSSSNDLDASASSVERSGPFESSEETPPDPLSTKWREIQGESYWRGLMDPLDLDLRQEILRYGDFAQLAYDNFEGSALSRYAGSARHPKQTVLQKLHKEGCGYQVTRYLYATSEHPLPGVLLSSLASQPWDRDSNWIGYVAVASDPAEIERLGRRDIVVSWRGAVRTMEWLVDAQTQMTSIRGDQQHAKPGKTTEGGSRPKVEKGFWSLFTCKRPGSQFNRLSASEQVIAELRRLLTLYKGEPLSITLTGHNLGGALAVLTAYEIAERGLITKPGSIPVTAITFGAPHVGDSSFRRRVTEDLNLKVLRVVNVHDVVPKSIANFYPLWGSSDTSKHMGVELLVNHKLSPYLKASLKDPLDWHNLECYLHLVDGYQGPTAKAFELVTGRDYALVNKYSDVLQERFCIPPVWWQAENKGLVMEREREGRWREAERAAEDTPSLANRHRFG